MAETDDILATIEKLAKQHLDWDEGLEKKGPLTLETRLIEDLELDSVDLTTLAVEVEDHFDISLEGEDEQQIVTLADLIAAIRRQLEDRDAEPSA